MRPGFDSSARPQLLDELLHPPSRDAGQVGIRDHRQERLLRPPARLKKPVGEVAALPELRDRERIRQRRSPVDGVRRGEIEIDDVQF